MLLLVTGEGPYTVMQRNYISELFEDIKEKGRYKMLLHSRILEKTWKKVLKVESSTTTHKKNTRKGC